MNCSSELVVSGSQLNTMVNFTDIAYEQGELYAISSSLLYKINVITGQVDYISLGNGIDGIGNGLTSNQSGFLYVAGLDFSRIDITNNQLLTIGDLGYSTQGDIEIVNGEFYITARDSIANPKLIKVTESPFAVTEIDSIPNNCYGASSHNFLPNNEIYLSKDSTLLVIDINTGSTTISCPNIFDNYTVYGLTKGPNNLNTGNITENEINIIYNTGTNEILIKSSIKARSTFCFRNSIGQIIEQKDIIDPITTIDTHKYSKGLYYIVVNIGEYVKTQKIILE